MKRLIKTVDLVFFNDEVTGDYGLAHKETYDQSKGVGFNAFWSATGIFHDIFEHSHEFTNKYFMGDYAMNIGGEMTAMGGLYYYAETMGVHNRLKNSNRNFKGNGNVMKESTLSEVHEAITYGSNYGSTLESNVPKQTPIDDVEFEYQLHDYFDKVKSFDLEFEYQLHDYVDKVESLNASTEYMQEIEEAIKYKQSVTFRKIADLHRYGYRLAEKLIPNETNNRMVLTYFIDFWDNFTEKNKAEDIQEYYSGLTIKLYKDENGIVTWKAIFNSRNTSEVKDAIITENTKYFSKTEQRIIQKSIFKKNYQHSHKVIHKPQK